MASMSIGSNGEHQAVNTAWRVWTMENGMQLFLLSSLMFTMSCTDHSHLTSSSDRPHAPGGFRSMQCANERLQCTQGRTCAIASRAATLSRGLSRNAPVKRTSHILPPQTCAFMCCS